SRITETSANARAWPHNGAPRNAAADPPSAPPARPGTTSSPPPAPPAATRAAAPTHPSPICTPRHYRLRGTGCDVSYGLPACGRRRLSSSDVSTLLKFAWLSVATAVVTIGLKTWAWWMTGSVGLLSDAAESVVNLVAAVVALIAITVAERPADADHQYGHSKAEYFSAVVEGAMIFLAAAVILYTGVERLINPAPLEPLGLGMALAVAAAVLNGVVGALLVRAGIRHRSPTRKADGKHLLTDVITSVGVVVGVALVWLTGWEVLDPLVAIAVGLNILVVGYRLVVQSGMGLMDATLPEEDNAVIEEILERHRVGDRVDFHE